MTNYMVFQNTYNGDYELYEQTSMNRWQKGGIKLSKLQIWSNIHIGMWKKVTEFSASYEDFEDKWNQIQKYGCLLEDIL